LPYELVIQGGLVEEREYTRRNVMPLKDFLPHLTSYTAFEMSPLPSGLKYLKVTPHDTTLKASLITQVDPAVTMIRFKNGTAFSEAVTRPYNIALPYLYFYFRMNSNTMFTSTGEQVIWSPEYWGVFWGNQPLTSLDVPAAPCGMPNCYDTGEVCHGSVTVEAGAKLGVWVDTAINAFLNSEFNMDLHYPWPYGIGNMQEWEDRSRDPLVWQEWETFEDTPTLGERLQRLSEADWPTLKPSSMDARPIPAIRHAPSFHNVEEWLTSLSDIDRTRFLEVAHRMRDDG
jgi:hypothetical protein